MEDKKGKIKLIVITALLSCLATNTVRDIAYVQNQGKVNNKVATIAKIIENYSLFDVDEDKMADYAAAGMAYSVDDHYTNYYSKEEFNSYKTNLSNSFFGVGMVVSVDTQADKIVVVSPVEGGPAANAGIMPKDYIIAVDGVEYSSEQMNDAVTAMRGDSLENKEGTTVKITVERDGVLMDFDVVRAVVKVNSVTDKMIDDEIGYIRISAFNSADENDEASKDTYDEFKESINELQGKGMKKLVIDLRNNPGGSLEVVNKIADELLPEGIITYTETKKGERETYTSNAGELGVPMCVLINGASASASEVLTGALKDYKKATIIGTKSFGKGIVQSVIPLRDGSGLSITTSKYFSPNGVCIHGVGIEPDIVVEMSEDKQISELSVDDDIQLQKAIEVLK